MGEQSERGGESLMKKIIVKVHLGKSREAFEQKLSDIEFDFSPVYWQHDRVYVPRGYKRGENYPRMIMRTEMKAVDRPPRYFIILKRHIEDSGIDVVYETPIRDYTEVVGIIQQLGFKLLAEVSRKRQEIKMAEGTILYLDKVEGVNGFFSKIETVVSENDSAERVREEVVSTFRSLEETNFVEDCYAEMIKK